MGWLAPSFMAASMPSMSDTPSILMKAASLIMGIRMRLTTKPAASLTWTGCLPMATEISLIFSTVSAGVLQPAMTSISFMRSAGLKKCIPTSGRLRPLPISVMDRDEVLEAKMHSGLQILSSSAKVVCLTFISSKAASTIRSQSAHRSSLTPAVMAAQISSALALVILPLATRRS